jgi:uncharacterized protein
MDMETAKKAVDFAFMIADMQEQIDFHFFGGEPFLRLSFIEDVIHYIKRVNHNHPLSFNISTNGTLLNDASVRFINKHNINLSISIDGPEHIHDKNRRDLHGKGTLHKVLHNIKTFSKELEHFVVNTVYGPTNVTQLDDTVRFLIEHNINTIHLNPDILATWDHQTFSYIAKSYEKLANTYIEMYNNGKKIALNLFDSKLMLFSKNGYDNSDWCGMGETEFGFAPSGNVYPCERFIGDDTDERMMMGNIYTGVNVFKRCSLDKQSENTNETCHTCSIQDYCMNSCGCTNYHMTGSINKTSSMICHSERHAFNGAKYIFESLQNNAIFLKHISSYANRYIPLPNIQISPAIAALV